MVNLPDGRLSLTQERFCQEYIIDGNILQAAQRAGYSYTYAVSDAYQLHENPRIQARIAELNRERELRTQIKADDTLKEVACIAYADPRRLFEVDDAGNKKLKHVSELDNATARAVKSVKVKRTGKKEEIIEIQFWDKNSALNKIGEMQGLWKGDKMICNQVNINLSKDEVQELFQKTAEKMLPELTKNRKKPDNFLEMQKKFGVYKYHEE